MNINLEKKLFQNRDHNHQECISTALDTASQICSAHEARFTPIRRRILELIWESHKPVLAYDLLKTLRKEKDNTEPPTVYRSIDFLMEYNLIHKIESLNAYVGCSYANRPHIGQFLICTECNQFVEIDSSKINRTILTEAGQCGFEVVSQTVEIYGRCPKCQ